MVLAVINASNNLRFSKESCIGLGTEKNRLGDLCAAVNYEHSQGVFNDETRRLMSDILKDNPQPQELIIGVAGWADNCWTDVLALYFLCKVAGAFVQGMATAGSSLWS